MKSGPALQKLAKHRIEALQRAVNAADGEAASIQSRLRGLDDAVNSERALAAASGDGADFVRYLTALRPKRAALAQDLDGAVAHANGVRAELLDAFADGKKIEILIERALARERAENERREQAQLDEIALRGKA